MSHLDGAILRRSTTAQQLSALLSERILGGTFGPGDRIRESVIATDLGVSRNTVREAVRILEGTGLVRYEVNRGAVVISPTVESLEAVYTARERLETAAVARPRPTAGVQAIETAFVNLEHAVETRDVHTVVAADLAFHAAVVGLLESERLSRFYDELTKELQFYLMVLSVADREFEAPDHVLDEHRVILEAIRSGDIERAVAEVRSHIEISAARVTEILAERG